MDGSGSGGSVDETSPCWTGWSVQVSLHPGGHLLQRINCVGVSRVRCSNKLRNWNVNERMSDWFGKEEKHLRSFFFVFSSLAFVFASEAPWVIDYLSRIFLINHMIEGAQSPAIAFFSPPIFLPPNIWWIEKMEKNEPHTHTSVAN